MLAFKVLVALLAYGGFVVHLVFLVRAHREHDYRHWRMRLFRLGVSFCYANGMAGVILFPDSWLSWVAAAVVLTCAVTEVVLVRREQRLNASDVAQGPANS